MAKTAMTKGKTTLPAASGQAKPTTQPSAAAGKKRKADDAPSTTSAPTKKAKKTLSTTVALNNIDAAATKAKQLKQVGPMQRSGLSNKFKKAELAAAAEQESTQALSKKRKADDDDDDDDVNDYPPTKKGKTDDDSAATTTATINHRILPPSTYTEQACDLLHKLPLELRDRIWADVLEEPGNVKLPGKEADTGEVKVPRPPIFQVCRQIRQEAWKIYYKVNTFETDDTDVANGFLKQISAEHYIDESNDDKKKKKVKSHPGLVALKGLLITDPYKVLQNHIDSHILEDPTLLGVNWGQIVGDNRPRSLRKIRRCLMAIKYASGRKGLKDGVVKFQMEVHEHQDVLDYFNHTLNPNSRVENFVTVDSKWLEVTAEQVAAKEFLGRSMFHNHVKYTTRKP